MLEKMKYESNQKNRKEKMHSETFKEKIRTFFQTDVKRFCYEEDGIGSF